MGAQSEFGDYQLFIPAEAAPGLADVLSTLDHLFQNLDAVDAAPAFARPGTIPAAHDLVRRDRQVAADIDGALDRLRSDLAGIGSSVLGHLDHLVEADEENAHDIRNAGAP
ncbi:hypothetical protein [Phytohabitans aurantiacus]|jgi:hypothetical protein|uniref:PE domain-containing protein n=1 Tax=Phytohabitans aurantiacus TaxID=3016789 RepID=A0ABQ5QZG4_9ACTN|nr:hypothetical protein [Phytohabitans aurantiacus]GLH99948.1 hypothetical protein Pa4123_52240 [Phytohabitans aurantiacus]